MSQFLMTASLLNSFKYFTESEFSTYEDFISTLKREHSPQTAEQMRGCQFENIAYEMANGAYVDPESEWYPGLKPISDIISGGQFQVKLYQDLQVEGVNFLLYGILDVLKAGKIYDLKTTKNYSPTRTAGKFYDSPQTSAYFRLVPEANEFTYLIYDFGEYTYSETYYREDTKPIEQWIKEFMAFTDKTNLANLYLENWRCKD